MKRGTQPRGSEHCASVLVRLLQPGSWIPDSHAMWRPIVESLLEMFLGHFDSKTLAHLLNRQRSLPASATPADRASEAATGLTALHKICQILSRSSHLPEEAQAALAPLESLPPSAIPDQSLAAAVALAKSGRPDLSPGPGDVGVARGSVADVFRFYSRGAGATRRHALKTVRPDALSRVRHEAAILQKMADESTTIAQVLGEDFSQVLVGVLRDAGRALLREIDFEGEASNLRDAFAFYKNDNRVTVPALDGMLKGRGILMEYVEGSPLLETPLDESQRREAARLVFRSVLLEPLFSGLEQTIFHADPHAGNILVQTRNAGVGIALLDWSQAGRLRASQRHALIELSLYCFAGRDPSEELMMRLFETKRKPGAVSIPRPVGNPLHAAFDIVQQMVLAGFPVPENLVLLRKAFFTVEGIALHIEPAFNSWRETRLYALGVLSSEAPVRAWSLLFAGLDQPSSYRSGLTTRKFATFLAGQWPKVFCANAK